MSGVNVLSPARESDVADIVREAAARSDTLEIIGGGTKRGVGQPFATRRKLSSAGLRGITNYDPAELVLTARAGTLIEDIDKALAENNQMLAFEPGDLRALFGADGDPTIGALAAANISGPRRITAGAARDALLGVRFVNGSGEIIKNGGRVMKNVTGLDLVKLMAGSWGTLGFLTEVSFKVLPRPETEATLAIMGGSPRDGAYAMAAAMGTSAEVTGAAHLPGAVTQRIARGALAGNSATVLRIEGFADSVSDRLGRLKSALASNHDIEVLDADHSAPLWRAVRDVSAFAAEPARPLWKISTAPLDGHRVAEAILSKLEGEAFHDWQGGLTWIELADIGDAAAGTVRGALADHGGGHATLLRASEAVRAATPVFQPQPPVLASLSERVRHALDPAGVFNPGRMVFDGARKAA